MNASTRPRLARLGSSLDRPVRRPSEAILFALAAMVALATVASWRYHFFFQNHANFIVRRVLPETGGLAALQRALGDRADPVHPEETRLDVYPFNTPRYMNYEPVYRDRVVPIASDFTTLWFFHQGVLEGVDPYRNVGWVVYNETIERATTLRHPGVPPQFINTGMSYFPGAPWLVAPFCTSDYLASLARYLVTFKLFLAAVAVALVRRAPRHRAALAAFFACLYLCASPVDHLVDRGNIEGIPLMLVAGFYAAYRSGRFKLAAVLLAVASSAKLFPALLFVLFLYDRRHRELALGLATLALVMLLSLLTFHAPLPVLLTEFAQNLARFRHGGFSGELQLRFTHSLATLLSALTLPGTVRADEPALAFVGRAYPALAAPVLAFALWRARALDFDGRALVATTLLLVLPPQQGHYSLIHLLPPLALYALRLARPEPVTRRTVVLLGLMSLVMVPKEYLVGFYRLHWGVSVFVTPLLLLALLAVALLPRAPDTDASSPS